MNHIHNDKKSPSYMHLHHFPSSPSPTLHPHSFTLLPTHTSSLLPLTLHPPHGCPPYPGHPQATVHVHQPTVHQVELEVTPENVQQILYSVCTTVNELAIRTSISFWHTVYIIQCSKQREYN